MVLDCHSHRSSNQIHASMIQKKKITLQYGDEVIVNLFIYIYIYIYIPNDKYALSINFGTAKYY